MKKMNIAIIEDVEDIRTNLKEYLESMEDVESVLAAGRHGRVFLKKAISKTPPDVVLNDIGLPGMNGIEGIKMIRSLFPDTILCLPFLSDSDKIFQSICAGATGYALKGTSFAEDL